jgi:hypothetical protein
LHQWLIRAAGTAVRMWNRGIIPGIVSRLVAGIATFDPRHDPA